MKTINTPEEQIEADKKAQEAEAKYEKMEADLNEQLQRKEIQWADYKVQMEAIQKYNPDFAEYFSDNEPDWMKSIPSHYRALIHRKLTQLTFEEMLDMDVGSSWMVGVWGTTTGLLDLCLYTAAQYIPKPLHYIPLLSIPLTNAPILYWMYSAHVEQLARNEEYIERVGHYKSLSMEQLLREAHEKDLSTARQKYTPTPIER
jgi:hypothetical protein